MKRYNINPLKQKFTWGDMDVIILGEEGRNRKKTIIQYDAKENEPFVDIDYNKIIKGVPENKWLAVLSGEGRYTRNTYGTVYVNKNDIGNVKVVAMGYGAWGLAGRVGKWNEFLVVVKPNTWFRIRPAGGSHKRKRYWKYFSEEQVYDIYPEELDLFLDKKGVRNIPDIENLVDLFDIYDQR